VRELARVKNKIKAIKRFLGLVFYYRKFVWSVSCIAAPSCMILQKDLSGESKSFSILQTLKRAHSGPLLLCILDTDGSREGVGAVLSQL